MSHVATVEIEINDLTALKFAAESLDLEFVKGQQTYRWYGRHVGDYPLPAGFTADDLGRCDHAIRIPDGHPAKQPGSYEIGVCKRPDGKPGYVLLWDFFDGGFGLQSVVGEECGALAQAYAATETKRWAVQNGYAVREQRTETGEIQLFLS